MFSWGVSCLRALRIGFFGSGGSLLEICQSLFVQTHVHNGVKKVGKRRRDVVTWPGNGIPYASGQRHKTKSPQNPLRNYGEIHFFRTSAHFLLALTSNIAFAFFPKSSAVDSEQVRIDSLVSLGRGNIPGH